MMRATGSLFFLLCVACAPPHQGPLEERDAPIERCESESGIVAGEDLPPAPFAPEGRSLRVKRSIVVRAEPSQNARPIGTLAQDMRVTWKRAVLGPDCDAWVEIEPRGWVCDRYLEDNVRAPRVRELPLVVEGELTPGVYARISGSGARAFPSFGAAKRRKGGRKLVGTVTVQLDAEVEIGRRRYWKTTGREYVEARFLRRYEPSDFAGLTRGELDGLRRPLAWAQARGKKLTRSIPVREAPTEDARTIGLLPQRTLVRVLERSEDQKWVSIAPQEWVSAEELHVAALTAPPIGTDPTEKWVDIDLDEQVLVAYEGEYPVFATLVSTGGSGHETPEGLFRIWIKFAETTMNSRMGEPAYQVSKVPWTMFFFQDFALHTSYWHDRFGEPTSHGCINLAPRDARALYQWADPDVPLGWSMAYATPAHPGSTVRVRSRKWLSPLIPATFVVADNQREEFEAAVLANLRQ